MVSEAALVSSRSPIGTWWLTRACPQYAVYRGEDLAKLVFLDMGVWNGTEGLSNPSTLSSTDGADFSNGTRPSYNMTVTSSWSAGQNVSITRLQAPGTNAKSSVSVSGVTFDPVTGARVEADGGDEVVQVGEGGAVSFGLTTAEGVLLQLATDATTRPGSGEASGASVTVYGPWSMLVVVAAAMALTA